MKTLLLIEDTTFILENLTEFLELEGYRVLATASGKEGVAMAKQFLPDLIICDVLMYEMGGHEVLRELMLTASTCDIPFIFSTSLSETQDCDASLAMGADGYLVKPFEPETLLKMIEKWLKKGVGQHNHPAALS